MGGCGQEDAFLAVVGKGGQDLCVKRGEPLV